MTDTIASRVTRVIGGSVHALLDAVEDAAPEGTMAQAIREVDQAVDEVRGELAEWKPSSTWRPRSSTSSIRKKKPWPNRSISLWRRGMKFSPGPASPNR